MSRSIKDKLYESIQKYVKNTAPGLIHTLNIYCQKLVGVDCITLFLEEPWVFKEILTSIYGSSPTVEMVARIFIYPVILETGIEKSLDELAKLLIRDPRELYRIIHGLF
ncbi:MAG: hypothetical protein QXP02_04780 [Desulfurococcaceae archaeon]